MPLLLPLNHAQRVDIALPEELILKEHMILLLIELIDLAEPIHVELPNKGLNLAMPEVDREDLLLQSLGVLDMNLTVVLGPANYILEFVFLR